MNIALVLAGGTGSRVGGDVPKQYVLAAGKPVISYCMETLTNHEEIDAIQIVADRRWQEFILEHVPKDKLRGFSPEGENRQMSILHGLEDIRKYASDEDWVLVHDAARPMVRAEQIHDCLAAAFGHDGVIPVLPMKDTVYSSQDGKTISSLLDRSRIFAGQAPELFQLGVYYKANIRLLPDQIKKINGSTEPAILAGCDMAMIPGEEENFKITTGEDLRRFRRLVEGR
ncbi:IspD/TarI family cytidylyltransferase [Candidatus Ventrimonas sp. KK005]|nr:2-C-methyl-D-erythritol 4-phosphate cytidylyltransferase [Lachnospiraceae bacterium]NBH18914.1 2-C-methyl-D-erythritol 4-phosphate cytidylyltransferase [Clostridiaceae bacterium]